jgi:adenosylcobinamide kinase/adenosylcobinamide-phosphate guanylyltransferase
MELYVGGAAQGKLRYVLNKKYSGKNARIADGADCTKEDLVNADVCNHFHLLVGRLLKEEKLTDSFVEQLLNDNPEIVIICDEVGSGIVPIEKDERIYRETVGRVLCSLAQRSVHMERILCGLGMRIK